MVLDLIIESIALYYGVIGNGVAYAIARSELADKSTEKIMSMKDWKDVSKLKKALYFLVPGVYFAVKGTKQNRINLENEFMKKYKIEPTTQ
jgi:hypothetical protein